MLKIVQKVCFPLSACVLLLKTEKKPAESRTRSVHVMIHMLCLLSDLLTTVSTLQYTEGHVLELSLEQEFTCSNFI